MRIKQLILLFLPVLLYIPVFSQGQLGDVKLDYNNPREYIIESITVTGAVHLNQQAIKLLSELSEGQKIKIPGEDITRAIKKLWDQKLFADVSIVATKIQGEKIWLDIRVTERPRLSGFKRPAGMRKSEWEKIHEDLDMFRGQIVTPNVVTNTKNIVRSYFVDKGYHHVQVDVKEDFDTTKNNMIYLIVSVKKGNKFKINEINIEGVSKLSDAKMKRLMKDTKEKKWWRFWKQSKFNSSAYREDREKIIARLNDNGYRDAAIVHDSVYDYDDQSLNIDLRIHEGNVYYIRNITWTGNSIYRSSFLDTILNIKSGDVYNQSVFESRLYMNPTGNDITSLYMDNGYLFFSVTPVEVRVEGDSIDFEMRIVEGKQARVKDIIIKGNTKTNDHVIRREIRTRPGDLFSRNDIIRTQRELAQLGVFDPENFGINPIPDPYAGTVDIEYTVEEKPSDQVELSAGWGAGRLIGTLGLTFNNFSIRKVFKKGAWNPVPSGDGQQISLRAQSTGAFYQGYNISFIEPWFGGKKPNTFSVSGFHTFTSRDNLPRKDDSKQWLKITGGSIGFGKRLKWPDDFFSIYTEIPNYQYYELHNYQGVFTFSDGYVNNLSFRVTLTRNSVDQPLFPRSGSTITLTSKFTPPYSFFNGKDYSNLSTQERFKWLEYNKLKFTTSHFFSLNKNKKHTLVMNIRTGFGFLLPWNKAVGDSPFERFKLGGSGLSGMNFIFGQEIIALRGYEDNALSSSVGDLFIAKYTLELRYPLSLNPNATVYLLGFAEAGNTWSKLQNVDPFRVKRSAGVGVRIFLPMFGLLGLDYGWGFDPLETNPFFVPGTGRFAFTIGMNIGEL